MNILQKIAENSSENISLSEDDLNAYWEEIVGNDISPIALNAKHHFVQEFERHVLIESKTSDLYLRSKGWKITVTNNILKTILVSPALVGILSYLGITQLSAIIIPTLLPMLFDIDNIELSKKEEEILLKLPINNTREDFKTADQWYNSLPVSIKEQVNPLDFKDFMEKFVLAGFAKLDKTNRYLLFKKGGNIFKITFE